MTTLQFVDNSQAVDIVDNGIVIMRAYDQGDNTALCRAPNADQPEQLIGQLAYHGKDDIQLSIPGSTLTIRKGSFLSRDYHVEGPGYAWKWERGLRDSFSLIDEATGNTIAKYTKSIGSSTSVLNVIQKLDDQHMDAAILTALAMTERRDVQKRKVRKTAAVSAAI